MYCTELNETALNTTVNINLFVSANAYDGDYNKQDEDHHSTADGNTQPDVHWSFLCQTMFKSYTF